MELTGKAKEDFKKWFIETKDLYDSFENELRLMSDTCLNAHIIEWFDSVGIFVNTVRLEGVWNYSFRFKHNRYQEYNFNTRQEATEQSIIKANDIYNERFK
ncbi:hypothetical protein [Empedobacter brevis]|uniref:hypothetical protein n=1 Tax=Empedobacter brevis TaxID=247 RepID=UPI00289D80F4|nr:hypothetical protein [Empedobacter brevis]